MKKRRRANPAAEVPTAFMRGFLVTGLLGALHAGRSAAPRHKVLRDAIQGGSALAAGSVAAEALARRDYSLALAALASGGIGVLAAEYLLDTANQGEKDRGQEEG